MMLRARRGDSVPWSLRKPSTAEAGIRLGHAVQRDMVIARLGPVQSLVAVA
jgi:hypothetical protein